MEISLNLDTRKLILKGLGFKSFHVFIVFEHLIFLMLNEHACAFIFKVGMQEQILFVCQDS